MSDIDAVHLGTTPWDWSGIASAGTLCEQARVVESLGFDSIWLPESHFAGARSIPQPLTLLAAIAGVTSSLQLGCTSYLLPIRHPLQAAEEVAVLDQLCNGRLILGLGRGLQRDMFAAYGVNPREKRAQFASTLALMRAAWRGESVCAAQDTTTDMGPVVLAPLPVQRPEPCLWVAAFGPLALRQVAELGLPYLASPMEPLSALADNHALLQSLVTEADKPLPTCRPVMRTVFLTEDTAQQSRVEAAVQRELQRRGTAQTPVQSAAWIGSRSYISERVAEFRQALGMTHLIVRSSIAGVPAADNLKSLEGLAAQ